jgi:hypothetical protein
VRRLLLILAIVASASVAAFPATAATTVQTVPFSGLAFNSCAGEVMLVEGTIRAVTGSTVDASGGVHFGPTHFTQHGTAIGLITGNRYIFNSEQTRTENFIDPGDEATLTGQVLAISQGREPNLISQATFHLTITPTGELTAFVSEINFRCIGSP